MPRTSLPEAVVQEVRAQVLENPGFIKLIQSARQGGALSRRSLRPVEIRGERLFQYEQSDGGQVVVKNLDGAGATVALEEILSRTGARELHLLSDAGDLHLRVTRKGRVLMSRGGAGRAAEPRTLEHDRAKHTPLTRFDSTPLLKVLEIADAEGRIKPSRRPKYDQINAFLSALSPMLKGLEANVVTLVDCGCGRAYLTLAAYGYLTQALNLEARVCGIDQNVRVIESARRMARALGWREQVAFLESEIATASLPFQPEILLSLHACDTATDEVLARGVEWRCPRLLCAPCCQHELHKSIKGGGAMRSVLRHGILRERLADILTDTFRAQILRILGYRVRIAEFVSSEATARNLMLKAEYGIKPGQAQAVEEYLALRDLWQVTPWLEQRLAERVRRYIGGELLRSSSK